MIDQLATEAAKEFCEHHDCQTITIQMQYVLATYFKSAIEKATEVRDAKWRDSLSGESRFCPCNEPPSMHSFDFHETNQSCTAHARKQGKLTEEKMIAMWEERYGDTPAPLRFIQDVEDNATLR